MTMIRPAATGLMSRVLDSVKAAAVALIGVTGWHFSDAGQIKSLARESVDQQSRLDYQRQQLERKVDREDYQADRKELHEDLREIRLSQDQIKQLLMERAR